MINFLLPILAYLIGSISSAVLVYHAMRMPDPRSMGSHNPGATNVLRIGGKTAAALTLVGDILKGLVPILLAKTLTTNPIVISLVGIAAFLGHLYPLFFSFKGGKGVATTVGVFIGLSNTLTIILVIIWITVAVVLRYSSLAALIAAALAPFLVLWIFPGIPFFIMSLFMCLFLFWRHRGNLSRLLAGTESRINLKRSLLDK